MSDRWYNEHRRQLFRQLAASFVLVFSLGIFLAPQAAFADEPAESFTLPAVCSDLLVVSPPPEEGEEAPEPTPPTWSALQVATTPRTNTFELSWQWTAPTTEEDGLTIESYGYALYNGETLVINGELTPDVVQYTYPAPADGTYRLFVWVNQNDGTDTTPEGCEFADSELDATSPAINGDSYSQIGNEATPLLSTTETDVTYLWTTDGDSDQVTIGDPTALNPTFTFLVDGTFTFDLLATDSLGNPTIVSFLISYLTPFVPTPEAPIPTVPGPIDPYIPPEEVLVQANKSSLESYNYGATAFNDTLSGDEGTDPSAFVSTDVADTADAPLTTAATPLESSNQGWLIIGIPWYWWLLGLAIIVTAWEWYRSGAFRKRPDDV